MVNQVVGIARWLRESSVSTAPDNVPRVTGKSRRLVLEGVGRVGSDDVVGQLVAEAVVGIEQAVARGDMKDVCEGVLDLAEFDGRFVAGVLDKVAEVVVWGFGEGVGEEVLEEWRRVRVAVHCLVGKVGKVPREIVRVLNVVGRISVCEIKVGSAARFEECFGEVGVEAGAFLHVVAGSITQDTVQIVAEFCGTVGGEVLTLVGEGLSVQGIGANNPKKKNNASNNNDDDEDNDGDWGVGDDDSEDVRNSLVEAFVVLVKKTVDKGGCGAEFEQTVAKLIYVFCLDWIVGAAGTGRMSYDDSCTLCLMDLFAAVCGNGRVLEMVADLFANFFQGVEIHGGTGGLESKASMGGAMIVCAMLNGASG